MRVLDEKELIPFINPMDDCVANAIRYIVFTKVCCGDAEMYVFATKPKGGSYDNLSNCAGGVVFIGRWRLGILPLASVAVYKSPTSLPGFFIIIVGLGLNAISPVTGGALQVLFDAVFTGLSGWLNGIRDMEVFQPSFHDQRKGTRACSPLTGSS
jgi:hypothetical protein